MTIEAPSSKLPGTVVITSAAMGVVSCALADMVHELLGHLTTAWLLGVRVLSLSTVAIQTASDSRVVASAGTIANVALGVVSLWLVSRISKWTAMSLFFWLFAAFNLLNSGYLVASALLGNGDWASVISGLYPAWAWRCALGVVGAGVYVWSVRALARAMRRCLEQGAIALPDLRRFVVSAYLAGGAILTVASMFNPIGAQLILLSGVGASFGLSAGLLAIPPILDRGATIQPPASPALVGLSIPWVVAAIIVGIIFVALLGPGIQFVR